MVVEEDHGLYPKISIFANKVPCPSPPPGTGLDTTLGSTKLGAIALFQKSHDRTLIKKDFDKSATFSHRKTISDFIGTTLNSSQFS